VARDLTARMRTSVCTRERHRTAPSRRMRLDQDSKPRVSLRRVTLHQQRRLHPHTHCLRDGGCGIPPTPRGLPHADPGAELHDVGRRLRRGLPPGRLRRLCRTNRNVHDQGRVGGTRKAPPGPAPVRTG
jgi:hypothetical protein